MRPKQLSGRRQAEQGLPSSWEVSDIIWVCRQLAAALQGDSNISRALRAVSDHAPARLQPLLGSMRASYEQGKSAGRGLIPHGLPAYIWGTLLSGELTRELGPALARLADRLEAEQARPRPRNRHLHACSLFFGRLAMMLQAHVLMPQAIEAAAESLPAPEVRRALLGVSGAVAEGTDLSQALARAGAELPPVTIAMIRDAEAAGNLPAALPVVADYLLDEAGGKAPGGAKEAHHA